MNHQYFEDLVVIYLDSKGEDLEPNKIDELNAHLAECVACKKFQAAVSETGILLRHPPIISPGPGFVDRWQERFQSEWQRLHMKQTILVLAFCLSALVLLSGSLLLLAWPWMNSPDLFAWFWISRMYLLIAMVGGVRDSASIFLQSVKGLIQPGGWLIITGLLSEIAVLWLVFFRLLTNPRRVSR